MTFLGAVTLFLCGCSGEEAEAGGTSEPKPSADAGAEVAPVADAGDEGAPRTPPTTLDVEGTALDYFGKPSAGTRLLLVDAHGEKQAAVTNASGTFRFEKVAPPYDLKVSSSSSSAALDRAYMGLTRRNPRVLDMAQETRRTQYTAKMSLTVSFPACPQNCSIQVGTSSPGGGRGGGSMSGALSPAGTAVTVEHAWVPLPGSPLASGPIGVDVLVVNSSYTSYWYAHLDQAPLQPNAMVSIGAVTPQAVSTFGPVTITTNEAGIPAEWRKSLGVSLQMPSEASTNLQQVSSSSLVTFLPDIPGATFGVSAWRSGESLSDPVTRFQTFSQKSYVTRVGLPLSVTSVPLTMPKGPEPARPTAFGTLSRGSTGLAWSPTTGLTTVLLHDRTANAGVGTFMTEGTELRFDRLANLGFTFRDGPHSMSLMSTHKSLDSALDPAGELLDAIRSWDKDGTDVTFIFDVTP